MLTVESAVKAFLLNHLRALSQFYDITVIVNTDNPNFLEEVGIKAKVIPLKIAREIRLFSDLICLFKLIKIFNHQHFVAVHSITPKAGLLGMLAAWVVRVPFRVHTFTGQVWETKVGFKRFILKNLDRLIGFLTTVNLSDGHAQLSYLIDEKVLYNFKSRVFLKGSIAGVDSNKFKSNIDVRLLVRQQLGILDEAIIFLFVGRLNREKGVLDLAHAFKQLSTNRLHLLFVGSDEQNMQAEIMSIIGMDKPNLHFVGYMNTPEAYMAAADVLCLPSYREGFNNVTIEAAAIGIPVIASHIYGITDAVVDGETGLLHAPRDIDAIKQSMQTLIDNKPLRLKLGEQARQRVIKDFDNKDITQAWLNFYQENISE